MCLIYMKYRIIFLIISLSAWVKYYYRILQTHHARTHLRECAHAPARMCARTRANVRTHPRECAHAPARMCARTHANVRTHPRECAHAPARTHHRRSGYLYSMGLWYPTAMACSAGDNGQWSLAIEINTSWWHGFPEVLSVFRI